MFCSVRLMIPLVLKEIFLAGAFQKRQAGSPVRPSHRPLCKAQKVGIEMGIQRLPSNLLPGKEIDWTSQFYSRDLDLNSGKLSVVEEKSGYIYRADESMSGRTQGDDLKVW